MRYQPLSRRLINLIYPLVIYMAIGMAVLGLYPNGGLMANLIEKVSCIIIMGILFYKDSKQIRWEGKKLSLYSAIIMIIIGICACIELLVILCPDGIVGHACHNLVFVCTVDCKAQLVICHTVVDGCS